MQKMSAGALRFPADVDRATFLRHYWQKRPLLMRGALAAEVFELDPNELAGLACEEEVESRLVIARDQADWEVRYGPFGEQALAALPTRGWTLLVQDVDKYVPRVAGLLDHFDFVPAWRIDDIMISYATDQGGVGPHSDNYDVFLMQAQGLRRWRISYADYHERDCLPGLDLRILSRFDTDEEWLVEPGDVLYLPPGVAHWGIAEGECMTYSLGLRVPAQQEIAADWFQYLTEHTEDRVLRDPDDIDPDALGQIGPGTRRQAAELLASLPGIDSVDFSQWLGRHLTEPKPQFQLEPRDTAWTARDLHAHLDAGLGLDRHPFSRFAWSRLDDGGIALFHNGADTRLPADLETLARLISERRHLTAARLRDCIAANPQAADLLVALHRANALQAQTEQ